MSPDGLHHYAVAVDGGGASPADVVRTGGFDAAAARAAIAAGAAICPAP